MKNFLKICACFMCIFVFSGCNKAMNDEKTRINTEINSNATIDYGGKKYEAKITNAPEGITTITLTSPENLAGVTFSRNGDKYEVTRKNLVGSFTNEPFESGRFPSNFVKILANISDINNVKVRESKEGETVYEGKIDEGDFSLTTDNSGRILIVEMPTQELSVKFC